MVQLKVLTADELESIHQATLRLLGEIGVVLTEPQARGVLTGAGAIIRDERVLLLPDLVEGALTQCPARVTVSGRSGQTVVLGDGSLHWHNLGGARDVYEPDTGERRSATVQDVRDAARLLDALENATTVKPVHGPGVQTAREVRCLARMAEVVGPPGEVLTVGISPVSTGHLPWQKNRSVSWTPSSRRPEGS